MADFYISPGMSGSDSDFMVKPFMVGTMNERDMLRIGICVKA